MSSSDTDGLGHRQSSKRHTKQLKSSSSSSPPSSSASWHRKSSGIQHLSPTSSRWARRISEEMNWWHVPWTHLASYRDPDVLGDELKGHWNNMSVVSTLVAAMGMAALGQPVFDVADGNIAVQIFGATSVFASVLSLVSVIIATILGAQLSLVHGPDVVWFVHRFETFVTLPEIFFNLGLVSMLISLCAMTYIMYGSPIWQLATAVVFVSVIACTAAFSTIAHGVVEKIRQNKDKVVASSTRRLTSPSATIDEKVEEEEEEEEGDEATTQQSTTTTSKPRLRYKSDRDSLVPKHAPRSDDQTKQRRQQARHVDVELDNIDGLDSHSDSETVQPAPPPRQRTSTRRSPAQKQKQQQQHQQTGRPREESADFVNDISKMRRPPATLSSSSESD